MLNRFGFCRLYRENSACTDKPRSNRFALLLWMPFLSTGIDGDRGMEWDSEGEGSIMTTRDYVEKFRVGPSL